MTDRQLGSGLLDGSLPHEPLPADEVLTGTPTAAVLPLGELAAPHGVEVGLWEMTEGVARDTEVDEVFLVLSGSGRVEFEDGSALALVPGVAVRLRAGERTVWTVTQTLRKVYVAG
ncbi:MAG: cupin domain-containing protein [Nocardioides sp.]